jgi:hypothetical protein
MTQFKSIRISIAGSAAAGLLWLGLGTDCVAAGDNTTPEDIVTPGTRMDRFTATVATDRVAVQFTGNLVSTIPGTTVNFTQLGNKPQAIVVTFVAELPKPRADEIPAGGFASGASIQLRIDGLQQDPISLFRGPLLFESGGVATPSSLSNGTHGFTFVTNPIPPGDHVATIVAFSDVLGQPGQPNGTIVVQARSTVVEHD